MKFSLSFYLSILTDRNLPQRLSHMANLATSSIREWVNFNGTLPRTSKSCQKRIDRTDGYEGDLLNVEEPLPTWVLQSRQLRNNATLLTVLSIPFGPSLQRDFVKAFGPFEAIGLQAYDIVPAETREAYSPTVALGPIGLLWRPILSLQRLLPTTYDIFHLVI